MKSNTRSSLVTSVQSPTNGELPRNLSAGPARTESEDAFLTGIGDNIRKKRVAMGMSRRALSELCGVSQRYLAQLEGGTGNISVLLLHRVAEALDDRVEHLISHHGEEAKISSIISLLHSADDAKRSKVIELLGDASQHNSKIDRIALIGLRGAGKSTLGKLVAEHTKTVFMELNEQIERISGIPVHEVMALYGNDGYRQLELQSLRKVIEGGDKLVLAVAGGIVTEPANYQYLLQNCFTIWLQALPEEHMSRVWSQGDKRPMTGQPDAMRQLRKLLANRKPLYAKADVTFRTSGKTEGECLQQIAEIIRHTVR